MIFNPVIYRDYSVSAPYVEYTFDNSGNMITAKLYEFTTIPMGMFYSQSHLVSVDLSESPTLEAVGQQAFYGCSNLEDITLPLTVTSLGTNAFYNCSKISFTSLPDGITVIPTGCFWNCSLLALTSLPSNITTLGYQALRKTNIAIELLPSTLTSVGSSSLAETNIVNIEVACSLTPGTNILSNNPLLSKVWLRSTALNIPASTPAYAPFADCLATTEIYAEPSGALSGWGTYFNRVGAVGTVPATVAYSTVTKPWA